jgi:type IV pilus assembly protein PilC
MTRFRYIALADNGLEIKGEVDSISEVAARDVLLQRNLEVQRLNKARRRLSEINITKQRVKPTEIMHFSRQLGAFVRAGIPLADGLDVIAQGAGSKRWREILLTVREEIATGVQFSDALAPHQDVFPPYYLGIIKSAELTGRLDTALDQLSIYMERDFETRQKIKSALAYPAVVLALAVVVIAVLTIYVLPKFADFFKGLGATLPLSTRMLISLANFMKNWWFIPVAVLVASALIVFWLNKHSRGRRVRDRLLLRIPVVNQVVLYSVVERICRILAAMSQAAVPLPDAMAAAIQGANNTVFEAGLKQAQERMLEGEGLAQPISDTHLLPPAAVQMMRVGEDTGTLDQQLESASEYFSRELDYKLKRLTTLFEPAVIIVMGVIVGFVAISLVQAMYGIYNSPALTNLK